MSQWNIGNYEISSGADRSLNVARNLVLSLLSFVVIAGCGQSQSDRVPISGTVTFADTPLGQGDIILTPLGQGRSAACKIIDGKFKFTQSNGPTEGAYKAEITSYQSTGKKIESTPGETVDDLKQIIPAKYSERNSELRIEVSADSNEPVEFKLLAD